ncbi:hypothetical protein SAMN04489721_3463 [Agromyces flavus]|nr:hypothetical protein SAMN04489721_3463 [Agromyces flavus]
MRLEITVLHPVEFTLSGDAMVFDNFANQQEAKMMNVYFPVTIKNVSPELTRDDNFVFTRATNVDEGEYDVLSVSDEEIDSVVQFEDLAPGQSVELKSGWSMSTLDAVQFEVDIDGLSGYSITFEQ